MVYITSERVDQERQRIEALLFDCEKLDALKDVIENVAWMKVKLDDARTEIEDASVAVPYDNGGGQTGIRENPLFKGYESLFKTYMLGMKTILDCLPEGTKIEHAETPKSVLQMVRARHGREA